MQHHNRQKSSTFPRDREVRKIYTFTIPREGFDELNPDKQILRQLISKHISMVDRLKKNMSYYEGKHKILDETKRENRLVCNHAKDISDTASSYFIGNPVTYKSEGDIKALTDALELAGADETDGDNGLEASIYGLAYEYVYVKENENNLQTKNLSAENTFMVKDDSIEENELFAVYYYIRKDDSGKLPDHYMATVVTTNYKYELDIENSNTIQATTEPAVPHYLGEIPIIEYLNNKLAIGDFELQIPLIDAYNLMKWRKLCRRCPSWTPGRQLEKQSSLYGQQQLRIAMQIPENSGRAFLPKPQRKKTLSQGSAGQTKLMLHT